MARAPSTHDLPRAGVRLCPTLPERTTVLCRLTGTMVIPLLASVALLSAIPPPSQSPGGVVKFSLVQQDAYVNGGHQPREIGALLLERTGDRSRIFLKSFINPWEVRGEIKRDGDKTMQVAYAWNRAGYLSTDFDHNGSYMRAIRFGDKGISGDHMINRRKSAYHFLLETEESVFIVEAEAILFGRDKKQFKVIYPAYWQAISGRESLLSFSPSTIGPRDLDPSGMIPPTSYVLNSEWYRNQDDPISVGRAPDGGIVLWMTYTLTNAQFPPAASGELTILRQAEVSTQDKKNLDFKVDWPSTDRHINGIARGLSYIAYGASR